jgi:hypothetical protein
LNDIGTHGHPARSRRPSAQPNNRISTTSSADLDISQYQNWLSTVRRMRIDREKLEYFNQLLQHAPNIGQLLTKETVTSHIPMNDIRFINA